MKRERLKCTLYTHIRLANDITYLYIVNRKANLLFCWSEYTIPRKLWKYAIRVKLLDYLNKTIWVYRRIILSDRRIQSIGDYNTEVYLQGVNTIGVYILLEYTYYRSIYSTGVNTIGVYVYSTGVYVLSEVILGVYYQSVDNHYLVVFNIVSWRLQNPVSVEFKIFSIQLTGVKHIYQIISCSTTYISCSTTYISCSTTHISSTTIHISSLKAQNTINISFLINNSYYTAV